MSLIAVSAMGPGLDESVDERFGRAHYFLFVDPDTLAVSAFNNTDNRNAMQGAGIASAEVVSDHQAAAVITGHLGPKAKAALDAAGVQGFVGTGMSVRDAVTAHEQGLLAPIQEAS